MCRRLCVLVGANQTNWWNGSFLQVQTSGWYSADPRLVIVDLLRYDNFVVCYTESYPQRIT